MKKILVYEHFIENYCKDSGDFDMNATKEMENLMKLKLDELCIKHEEEVRIMKLNHEVEIKKYQEKIKEIMISLKKEKIKSKKLAETAQKAINFMKNSENPSQVKNQVILKHEHKGKSFSSNLQTNESLSKTIQNFQSLKEEFQVFNEYITKICQKFPIVLLNLIKTQLKTFTENSLKSRNFSSNFQDLLIENHQLQKKINELRGNIRVFCRVRPLLRPEDQSCIQTSDKKVITQHPYMKTSKVWEFDKVFNECSSQSDIFEDVKDLVSSSFDGYNVCVFTYGQTGSGKTFTLEGPDDNPGLIHNICTEMFEYKRKKPLWEYKIRFSIIEVYNDDIRDLLNHAKGNPRIVQGKVKDVKKKIVNNLEQLIENIRNACEVRSTSSNSVNLNSSRSHLVITFYLKGQLLTTTSKSQMQVVDLAGSERLGKTSSKGETLTEAKHINLSLHVLGSVISAKNQKNLHIPYRNSILTQVLQSSFEGDAKVLMIAQISPEIQNYDESISSLNFASLAKNTSLGIPRACLS
jgi:kinesin family protein C2/C3